MSYIKSLKSIRKELANEASQEPAAPETPVSRGFASRSVMPATQAPQELRYDPSLYVKNAMRRIQESRVAFAEKTAEATKKAAEKAPKASPIAAITTAVLEDMPKPILDEAGNRPGQLDREGGVGPGEVTNLHGLIDRTESGGGYDTLYGHANKDKFKGYNITTKTIGELKSFANGEYGQHSKEVLGYKATPMGRYQFVGSTMSAVAGEMGLPDDTVFTPAVQDDMFAYWAKKTIGSKSGAEARSALRGQWEGFKSVSNKELDAAIEDFRVA
jgi:hypothetical protein